jgi:hypothetical protein
MELPPLPEDIEFEKQLISAKEPDASSNFLPGQPRISLDPPYSLIAFLEHEFCSDDLEKMSPKLWMMSMQSSANISPLHRQRVKEREIIITEDPKLHLVWIHNRIFIKPLPGYLLSYGFWRKYLMCGSSPLGSKRELIRAAALGYLRTWYHLVKHHSDFKIAQEKSLQLIPENITWHQFCRITALLNSVDDQKVSERYHYGEIRLTRLNFYAKLFLHKWSYQRMQTQYSAYFAQFYGPILFLLGILSVSLNCMQVVIAVEQIDSFRWSSFWNASRWASVIYLIMLVNLILGFVALFLFKFVSEWKRALTDRRRLKLTCTNLLYGPPLQHDSAA